jgi:hypothetical protein
MAEQDVALTDWLKPFVEKLDEAVLNKIRSTYKDVRTGEAPITSWLLDHGDE